VPVSVGQDQRRAAQGLNDHQLETFLAWIRDKPIELRFIELMQTGEMDALFRDHHTSGELIKQRLQRAAGCSSCAAWMMALPGVHASGLEGRGGAHHALQQGFLRRLQPAAGLLKGKLHLCLFGDNGVELRDLLTDDSQQEALQWRIRQALPARPPPIASMKAMQA
jgi:cyclic pyranopterin phosphate synthase